MYCPNCGVELVNSNQNFCWKCGKRIPFSSAPSKLATDSRNNYGYSPNNPSGAYKSSYSKPRRQKGPPGEFSLKCLKLAILSIVLFIIALLIVPPVIIFSYYGASTIIGLVVSVAFHVLGIISGYYSRVSSREAIEKELMNYEEIVGSIVAVFGIVLNAIFLPISFIFLVIFSL